MANSVSNNRLKCISGCFLKFGEWKALEMRLTAPGSVQDGGEWRKIWCCRWAAVEAPGTVSFALLTRWSQLLREGRGALWGRQSMFRRDLVSHYHVNKQLSIVSKSRALVPACLVQRHVWLLLAVPSCLPVTSLPDL